MNQDLTHVTAVLDASGSMGRIKEGTIEGFNSFFREQAEVEGEMTVTLYEFSSKLSLTLTSTSGGDPFTTKNVRRQFRAQKLSEEVPTLTDENYEVGGQTPLYDAMNRAIDETGERLAGLPEEERPGQVIVLVLSDGAENDSYAIADSVEQRITHQRGVYDWEFLFLGTDQDAMLESGKVGIDASLTVDFDTTNESTKRVISATSENVSAYRMSGDKEDLRYRQ